MYDFSLDSITQDFKFELRNNSNIRRIRVNPRHYNHFAMVIMMIEAELGICFDILEDPNVSIYSFD